MSLKNDIIKLLENKKYEELVNLPSTKTRILTKLISLTYDKKSVLSWRSIEAIGIMTGMCAESDPELVRHTVERLLWMIRDESGGIGWSSPEILGEIVRNNSELCSDIALIIVPFIDELPLRAGVLRAIGRIGKTNTEMVGYAIPRVLPCLKSPDPFIRGYAVWALGEIGASGSVTHLEKLKEDNSVIQFYESGELMEKTIGEISSEALKKLR